MCFSETHTHTHTHICSKQIIFAGCRVVRVCTGLSSKEDIVKIAVFPAGSSCFLLFFSKFVASEGFMRVLWSFFLLMTRVLLLRAECEQLLVTFLEMFWTGNLVEKISCHIPFSILPFCQHLKSDIRVVDMFNVHLSSSPRLSLSVCSLNAASCWSWALCCWHRRDFATQSFLLCLMWDKNPSIDSSLRQLLQHPTDETVSRLISQILENFQETRVVFRLVLIMYYVINITL